MTNKNSLSKNSDDQDENKTQLELQPLASSKEIETMENPLLRKPLSKENASEIKGAQTKVNTTKQHNKTKSFFAHEAGDGSIYYESVEKPGETTWKLPENAVVLDDK